MIGMMGMMGKMGMMGMMRKDCIKDFLAMD